jgi:hypothetical protein
LRRINSIRKARTLTSESDGAMTKFLRRDQFRVTGAIQSRVVTINGNEKQEPASDDNAGSRYL